MATAPQFSRRTWLVLGAIAIGWWMAAFTGGLDVADRWATDLRFRVRGEISSTLKVSYIDVDSRSIADLGNQPWDRAYFAEVADALVRTGKAKAVGIDYVFSDNGIPDLVDRLRFDEGRRVLAEYLNQDPPPPVVVAASYAAPTFRDINLRLETREFPRVGTPAEKADLPELPEFRSGGIVLSAPHIGLIDSINGETREVHAFAEVGPKRWHHMAIELMRLYWGLTADDVVVDARSLSFRRPDGSVLSRIPLAEGQDVTVNWFSAWRSTSQNSHASFSQALVCARALRGGSEEERRIALDFFKPFEGGIVLIGPVDPLLQDLAKTPLDHSPVPRVGLHGNFAKSIAEGRHLRTTPLWLDTFLQLVLTLAIAVPVLATGPKAVAARVAGVGLLAGYIGVAFLAFNRLDWVLPVALPLGSAMTAALAALAIQLVSEEQQKKRIQGLFGTYLSPELVNRMVESGDEPHLGGEQVEITSYFSDIENFTTMAESLEPARLVELMNEYLTECTDSVTDSGGTLDKYVGDAVVAMFGAPVPLPDHAWRACTAACRVQDRIVELRKRWTLDTARWPGGAPELRTRIGLASGPAVVGNMGSATRFNYTMMGDTVNLAARLESIGRNYGAPILVTARTREQCIQFKDTILFRPIDRLVVKGRREIVTIYEVMGQRERVGAAVVACAEAFAEGIAAYWERRWDEAEGHFRRALENEPGAAEGRVTPSAEFLRRIAVWRHDPPPADWTGIWVADRK